MFVAILIFLKKYLHRKAINLVKATSDSVNLNSIPSKSWGVGWGHIGESVVQRKTFLFEYFYLKE